MVVNPDSLIDKVALKPRLYVDSAWWNVKREFLFDSLSLYYLNFYSNNVFITCAIFEKEC